MTYFTPVEAARKIHPRSSLVYMLLRTGELPFYQMPGARGILVSENDLYEFMRRYRVSGRIAIEKLVEVQKCSA